MDFHVPISGATSYTSNLNAQPPLQHAIRITNLVISAPICVGKPTKSGT